MSTPAAPDVASWPWPFVRTAGELGPASVEWLHGNGAGAYSMSTVAMMHTRREHGLLVAALSPPVGRTVILSHAEATLEVRGRKHRLATHQFPGLAPTPGYRELEAFAQDPIPTWTYRIAKRRFVRTVAIVPGRNAVVLGFTWHGRRTALLTVRPLLAVRPLHRLVREHGAILQTVGLRAGVVQIQPVAELPPVLFSHTGIFVGSPDWWRRFEYAEDGALGLDHLEDLWTPGTIELRLVPNETVRVICALGELPEGTAEEHERASRERALGFDVGEAHGKTVRLLSLSAAPYCADRCDKPAIIAGYPFWDVHVRDLLISLPGLFLARGDLSGARRVLAHVCDSVLDGQLPRRLDSKGKTPFGGDQDLWFMEAARQFMSAAGADDELVRGKLFSATVAIFERVLSGTPTELGVGDGGLVFNESREVPGTWMNARTDDGLATPRCGAPVEFQALWAVGCALVLELATAREHVGLADRARSALSAVTSEFRKTFWCNETKYPFDVVSADAGVGADASVRPNALMALALAPALFERWQADAILRRVERDLLTPRGLRTLPPDDPRYSSFPEGGPNGWEASAHQGPAWTFLLGFYARAKVHSAPSDDEVRMELTRLLSQAASGEGARVLGQVGQLADGDPPHKWRGCPAQAFSVAEILRALVQDLGA